MSLKLELTKRTDERLLKRMAVHYSEPQGFVGRNMCYAIMYEGDYYGHIVAGSATRFLPGRNEFFGVPHSVDKWLHHGLLRHVVNNVFFNISRVRDDYPTRNFVPLVLKTWREVVARDWFEKYGDEVIGYESLIELPRTGEAYKRDGWVVVGQTQGYTCKREGGTGTDSWTGRRVWNTTDLYPKLVFVRHA